MTEPKLLYWDIETSLQPVAVFQLANNDWIDPSNILQERYVICGSWQWEGESKIHSVSVLDDLDRYTKDPHDDYHVVKVLVEVLAEADCLIHHNGDSFDKRYVDTRALIHGMPTAAPVSSIDTYKVAKAKLMLNSNKLDYLGKLLGVGRKKPTSAGLWLRVMNGDKKAIKEMVEYNKQDVKLLRDVFMKLRPYVPNYISRELFGGTGCPRCGSKSYQSRGVHRAITKIYQRYCCNKCGGWFRELKADKGSTRFRVL